MNPCRLAIFIFGMLGALAGCAKRNQFQPPPPPTVTVANPVTREVTDWIEFTGTTRATATVELRARVRGYLQQISFADGAHVNAGDLLFVIEKAPFEAELEAATANLARAQAARQLAEANLARTTALFEKNASPRQQLDIDTAELATARANERAAQANVTQAQLNLGYTEIRAPIAGRIGRHLIDTGNLVLPDQTLLAVIESIDPIHAYFYLSEQDLLRFMAMLRDNQLPDPERNPPELFLALANENDFPHRGKLDFREYGVEPATGTAERRGEFPNPDLAILPGMFVRIRAAVGLPRAKLLIDERAIGADQRGDFVLVVGPNNVVEHRAVKLGVHQGPLRVVEQGLQPADSVVVNGVQRARPGAPVNPETVTAERPPAPPAATAQAGAPPAGVSR